MRTLAAVLALSLASVGCREETTDRWATTANTNVNIDWDKLNEAYKLAEGPEDFERRVNEIYEGEGVISVAVQDVDSKVQEVTGFFDKNASGTVDEGEKVFGIKRVITGEGTAQVQTTGYGYYGGYHSPLLSIASGVLIGSMLSRSFSPGYVPIYSQPYTTPPARATALRTQRSQFRAANPSRFSAPKASGSGRAYGRSSAARPRAGGRFGIRGVARTTPPVRLAA